MMTNWCWTIDFGRLMRLYIFIGVSSTVICRPMDKQSTGKNVGIEENTNQENPGWQYLVRYGYVSSDLVSLSSTEDAYHAAITKFANDIGEKETDHSRLTELMKSPRCSKGLAELKRRRRGKRFVAHVTKWDHQDIRWRFRDPFEVFQNSTDYDIAKETLAHALSMWSFASKNALKFRDLSTESIDSLNGTQKLDIDIFFAVGDHGDHEPFDGRGGIVAHSGYPPEGKIHFDASESWMINGESGIDLRYVTLHETGHALGLRHSRHKDAIMHPIYRSKTREIALSDDDIKGIRYLYPADNEAEENFSASVLRNRNRGKKLSSVDFEDY